MVDCVGYIVKGANGYFDDGESKKVHTPWFDYEIPFEDAAEIGTRKVIIPIYTSYTSICSNY